MRLYDVMRLMIRYMGLGIKIFALLAIICMMLNKNKTDS